MLSLFVLLLFIGATLSDGICPLPDLPFENKDQVIARMQQYEECWLEYLKCSNDQKYKGMEGFKEMFGDDGYFLNRSSRFNVDGKVMKGFGAISAKLRFTRHLMCIPDEFTMNVSSIEILEWGSYDYSYSFPITCVFNLPGFNDYRTTIKAVSTIILFHDGSGIIKYIETNSERNLFGAVISNIMDTTEAIADLFGFDDMMDDTNSHWFVSRLFGHNINPVMVIFLIVICAFTTIIAVVMCVLFNLCYKKATYKYEPVNITSADDSDTRLTD